MAVNLDTLFSDIEQLARFRARFESRLRREGECLIWSGAKTPKGYGVVGYGPRSGHHSLYTHRVALWLSTGQDAGAALVMHTCDNPACCTPSHLSCGSARDNTDDMLSKERESRGEAHPSSKLTEQDVRAIRQDRRSLSVLSSVYGVDPSQIARVKRRENWKHIT